MKSNLDNPKWLNIFEGEDRANFYPYDAPNNNFLLYRGKLKAIPKDFDFFNRVPVLASGSNRSPGQILRKFGNKEIIPVTIATLNNCDIIYASLISYYGAVPTTLWPALGCKIRISITWLTKKQLNKMHKTEAVGKAYNYVRFNDGLISADGFNDNLSVYGYVSCSGALNFGDNSPRALSFFKAKNRLIKSVNQFSALKCVAKHTIKDSNNVMVKLFRRKIIENQNFRLKVICKLKASSIKYKQVPWAIFKVSNVDYREYY